MKQGLVSGILIALLMLALPAAAQQGTSEVRGRVVDQQGSLLPGVTVTVRNQQTGMYRETASGEDGSFIVSGVVPGTYQMVAELQGFKKFERRDLVLEVGKTATIEVSLEVGALTETVNVTTESPLVDVTSKEIGGNITSATLTQLPSVNGNFIGFIGLLPGIVPSISTESFGSDAISVNGQDPRNNNYSVDGGNNNDDVIGQRAGMQARTPIEAIQEFQVITNQFDAEFGRTSGAVVNAVTKAGTNNVRGSAFGFLQDGSLTTKDFFAKQKDLTKADTSYQRWGGTVGGPIVRDKIQYFFSLERFAIDRPNTIVIPARPDLNDQQTTKDRVWNTIIRGDHQINASNTYSVRWLRETSPQTNQIIPTATQAVTAAAAREESDVDQTLAFNVNSVLSNTKVNTMRLTWTRENVAFANACFNGNGRDLSKCLPTLSFQDFIDQQDNTAQSRINDAIQLDDTVAWFVPGKHGDHDVKLGAQYQVLRRGEPEPGRPERDVRLRPERRALQRVEPLHLSGPVHRAGRRSEQLLREGALCRRVRPGQVAPQPAAHAQPWAAIRHRDHPSADHGRPAGRGIPSRQEQLPAARGRHLRPGRRPQHRPRRLRALLRQIALRADRRPLHRHALHVVVHRELPDGEPRCGPAQRPVPDGSLPGQRADREPCAAARRTTRAASCCGTPAPAGTTRIAARRTPTS